MKTRAEMVAEARSYLGTPFHHQGRMKGVGVDCVGILCGLADFVGLPFQDIPDYNLYGRGVDLPGVLAKYLRPISKEQARPGDALVLWYSSRRWVGHCGIMTPAGLLHTSADLKRVIEHRMDEFWQERWVGAFAYPGVVD